MTMENSSRPVTSRPVHVTSHPALMHVGGMDLVGNFRTSHGSGRIFIKIFVLSYSRSLSSGTSEKLIFGMISSVYCSECHPPQPRYSGLST